MGDDSWLLPSYNRWKVKEFHSLWWCFERMPVKVVLALWYLNQACLSKQSNNDDLSLSLFDSVCLSACAFSVPLWGLSWCSLICLCFFFSVFFFFSVSLRLHRFTSIFTFSSVNLSLVALTNIVKDLLSCKSQQNIARPSMQRHTDWHRVRSVILGNSNMNWKLGEMGPGLMFTQIFSKRTRWGKTTWNCQPYQ